MDICSNNYFKKLQLNYDISDVQIDAENLNIHGSYVMPQKYGLALNKVFDYHSVPNKTYEVLDEDRDFILNILPKEILDLEIPKVWVMNIYSPEVDKPAMLAPHIDKVRKSAINVYFDTHGEKTTYYSYKSSKLEEVGSFVAQDNEWWLLNSDEPHSVLLNPPHLRKVISISFIMTPYEKLATIL